LPDPDQIVLVAGVALLVLGTSQALRGARAAGAGRHVRRARSDLARNRLSPNAYRQMHRPTDSVPDATCARDRAI
jgi:Sec-independent protein translocase protein TatA